MKEIKYSFCKSLFRDAAYNTMLSTQRREAHERIASILENDFPERIKNDPGELANHYSEANIYNNLNS